VPSAQALAAVAEGRLVVVVRDLPAAELEELLAAVSPAVVQLHGEEPPELVRALRAAHPEVEVWKVLAVAPAVEDPAAETERLLALTRPYAAAGVAAFLLDTQGPGGSGGTGQTGDWAVAAELARRLERPLILAGGLTPENLAAAAAQVQPAGLDVSSGVEEAPGCKSPARLAALFRALRA
jgi:phosphoribosylanthranilate isomerase